MTDSRAKSALAAAWGVSLAFAVFVGAGTPALAQGAPIQLIPIKPQYQTPPPAQSNPPAPVPSTGVAQPQAGVGAAKSPGILAPAPSGSPLPSGPKDIEVDKLAGIDTDGVGVLDPSQGGLGLDLWRGVPRMSVATLIAALPGAITSPVLRDLAHRVLLSSTNPPEGSKGEGPSLLTLRARKLAEMGDAAGLQALGTIIPAHLADEALQRARVESGLLQGETSALCAEANAWLKQYQGVYWQKLQVFCAAVEHKTQAVDLGVSLLHEEGESKDTAYFTLIDALMGNKGAKVTSLPEFSPLHLAMMRVTKAAFPEDVLRAPQPAVLRAVADSPGATPDLRLAAAERAATSGALSGDALARLYEQVAVSDAELANALTAAEANYGPRARVLLYRVAKAQRVPAARAEAIRAALALARAGSAYQLAVTVNLPFIEELTPSPELGFAALEIGRALYYAGRIEAAGAWVALAHQDSAANAQAIDMAVGLWPYERLAARTTDWDDTRYLAWRAAQEATKDVDARLVDGRAAHLLGLYRASGVPVPQSAWRSLAAETDGEPAAMPPLAVSRALNDAARDGRRGETVLLVLLAIGGTGVESANPVALDDAIEALGKVGLEFEARRLAIEAAVASSI